METFKYLCYLKKKMSNSYWEILARNNNLGSEEIANLITNNAVKSESDEFIETCPAQGDERGWYEATGITRKHYCKIFIQTAAEVIKFHPHEKQEAILELLEGDFNGIVREWVD